ncbi:MAG: tetratricopeptide repeat protein [Deltaproteobacteria bacterium]|nr:MAG: tetratricopeptide repeat protein [Deltaproteobacteria bacterium]
MAMRSGIYLPYVFLLCLSLFLAEVGRSGRNPIARVDLFEDHAQSYLAWQRFHHRDRIVVHFDAHSDIGYITPEARARIVSASRRGDLAKLAEMIGFKPRPGRPIGIANFLFAAICDATVRKVYWVIPDPVIDRELALEVDRQLRGALSPEPVAYLGGSPAGLHFRIGGVEVVVVTLSALPAIEAPVLLDIDTDFFFWRSIRRATFFENGYALPTRFWISPRDFLTAISERLSTDHVTISRSVNGFFVPLGQGWLAEELRDRLRGTGDLRRYEVLHELMRRLAGGEEAAVLAWVRQKRSEFPKDPYLHLWEGRLSGEDAPIEAAIRLAPRFAMAWIYQANEALLSNQPAQAKAHFSRIAPDNAPIAEQAAERWYAEGLRRVGAGQLEEAVAAFRAALRWDPKAPATRTDLAATLLRLHQTEEAERIVADLLDEAPDDPSARFLQGNLFLSQGRWAQARDAYLRVIERRPNDVKAYNNLGKALVALGKGAEAIAAFERVIALDPDHYAAYGNLGLLYHTRGEDARAREMFRKVLALHPEDRTARRFLEELSRSPTR